jgi:hypothetical protein
MALRPRLLKSAATVQPCDASLDFISLFNIALAFPIVVHLVRG